MKIAHIGQKGIPGHTGGVEAHVDELARRLTLRSHQVTVYVRSWYTPRRLVSYQGVQLVHTPTIRTKHLDASVHSLTSSLHALSQDYDIVHFHAIGPSAFAWLPRQRGCRIVVTVHALDWQRPKWGFIARSFLKMAERCAVYLPDRTITVSRTLQQYLEHKYRRPIDYVPNGVDIPRLLPPDKIRAEFGLMGDDYILYVSRLVPEKRVDWLVRAFRQTSSTLRLVIAGDDADRPGHARELHELAGHDERIVFTGNVTGQIKAELLSNAHFFVLPSRMEGLPIALLEAMSYRRCSLVSDIPCHSEIITSGQNGLLFPWEDFGQFAAALNNLLAQDDRCVEAIGQRALGRVQAHYRWDDIVDAIETSYRELLDKASGLSPGWRAGRS